MTAQDRVLGVGLFLLAMGFSFWTVLEFGDSIGIDISEILPNTWVLVILSIVLGFVLSIVSLVSLWHSR